LDFSILRLVKQYAQPPRFQSRSQFAPPRAADDFFQSDALQCRPGLELFTEAAM
jgi:hypothetical protein